ncbi:hypothetical protein D3C87_1532620 [compost metagenome]
MSSAVAVASTVTPPLTRLASPVEIGARDTPSKRSAVSMSPSGPKSMPLRMIRPMRRRTGAGRLKP